MKTNQILEVNLGRGKPLSIGHKTMMGSLQDVLIIGGLYRYEEGLPQFNLKQFLNKKDTRHFIETLKTEKGIQEPVKVLGVGHKGGTIGHLYFILYMAQQMSAKFAIRVLDVFIENEILQRRDDGGNEFKKLNVLIDSLPDRTRELKPKGNGGCYVQTAKMIRVRVFSSEDIALYGNNANIWNSKIANATHQLKRAEYENKLCLLIEMGYINSWDELKEAIVKL